MGRLGGVPNLVFGFAVGFDRILGIVGGAGLAFGCGRGVVPILGLLDLGTDRAFAAPDRGCLAAEEPLEGPDRAPGDAA